MWGMPMSLIMTSGRLLSQHLESLRSAARDAHLGTALRQHSFDELARVGLVIDDQDVDAGEIDGLGLDRDGRCSGRMLAARLGAHRDER